MRGKHGQYGKDKNSPNNAMQPVGSGYNVWLKQQILDCLGEERGKFLIQKADKEGVYRYAL